MSTLIELELDESQRNLVSAIRAIDEYLRKSPNGDGPKLVRLKVACLAALSALGKAAQIAEGTE